MAWESLKDRLGLVTLNPLPVVLAGPILRRVEAHSVSVWIACRQAFSAKLFVGLATSASGQSVDIKIPANQLAKTPNAVAAVALGTNLHVLVVTAVPVSQTALQPGTIYQYSIEFDLVFPTGNITQWLDNVGILSNAGGLSSIAYGNFPGPTFLLPPAAAYDVKFAHASCRKPHGGEIDALAALHEVLTTTHADAANRPQQLFHTGDQIYADDVDDILLYMIKDAHFALLAWPVPEPAPDPLYFMPSPTGRQVIVDAAKFTTTEGKNHLLYLGEFYAMYLFAWSETIWPDANSFPAFESVYPLATKQLIFLTYWGPYSTPMVLIFYSDEYLAYLAKRNALTRFLLDLPKVRKALANISSYMMMDDHEVTDDWFLCKEWCEGTLAFDDQGKDTIGRRIMQNALAAFAVFQAWGNTPGRFASQDGRDILDKLALLGTPAPPQNVWPDIGLALLPSLNPTTRNLEGGFPWHFYIDFDPYRLIVLDTRTHRGFDGDSEPPRLINSADLPGQVVPIVGGTQYEYVLVLSPAPVVGYVPVEYAIEYGVATVSSAPENFARILHAAEFGGIVWVPGKDVVTSLLKTCVATGLYRLVDTPEELGSLKKKARSVALSGADYEMWAYHPKAFQELLRQLSQYPRVVILSGDVHYGFSNAVEYWNDRDVPHSYSIFVQLCSSAARNTGTLPWGVEDFATYLSWTLPDVFIYFGRDIKDNQGTVVDNVVIGPFEAPIASSSSGLKPDWQYRFRYGVDGREAPDRGLPPPPKIPLSQLLLSKEQLDRLFVGKRVVVGADNIGLVRFAQAGGDSFVQHDFHWSLVGSNPLNAPAPKSHTQHILPLKKSAVPAKPWP